MHSIGVIQLHADLCSAIAGITIKLTYGIDIADNDEPLMVDAQKTIDHFNDQTKPGAQFVEFFRFREHAPCLLDHGLPVAVKYVPGMPYKRMVPQWRREVRKVLETPANIVMDELQKGIIKQTVAHELLQEPDMSPERLNDVQWTLASVYFGGIDTVILSVHVMEKSD